MAIVAIMFVVRSSDAANCTSTTFTQGLSAIQLNASQIIAEDYATLTKQQIIQTVLQTYNDTVVSFDYNVTTIADLTTIQYKIIFACIQTTTTVLPDGTTTTNQASSKVNASAVQNTVTAGL